MGFLSLVYARLNSAFVGSAVNIARGELTAAENGARLRRKKLNVEIVSKAQFLNSMVTSAFIFRRLGLISMSGGPLRCASRAAMILRIGSRASFLKNRSV